MITLCWAVKGGSGTTTTAAVLALSGTRPALLVDLDGELPTALGVASPAGPGVRDWVASDAPPDHLADLVVDLGHDLALLPQPADTDRPGVTTGHPARPTDRWEALGAWLAERAQETGGAVVIDAGTGAPPDPLVEHATHRLLVTRACYLALRRASRAACRPSGVVLVREAGRSLGARDVETSVGAPVVATIDVDPAVARAIDSGLLGCRVPWSMRRHLQRAAA